MLNVTIQNNSLKRLADAVAASGRKLPRELAVAVNATAAKTKSQISREIRKELAAKSAAVTSTIKTVRRATPGQLGATVRLHKTSRLPLRDFGARQNKTGVSYKISKSGGRQTITGAFQGPKPGLVKASWRGHVFRRVGKKRLPIVKLMGPSPWGVFVRRKLQGPTKEAAAAELKKQIERRVRFNVLKASGAI